MPAMFSFSELNLNNSYTFCCNPIGTDRSKTDEYNQQGYQAGAFPMNSISSDLIQFDKPAY